jgi:outer membrane receptor protein involved in Fe transport
MRSNSTIRVNAELLPESVKAEEIVVVGKAPTIDVGSSSAGVTVTQDFTNRISLNGGSANRSFEDLATVAPGAHGDGYGVSINGTTSPENSYVIDGLSVNDPAFGINGSPLSQEFIKEVNVVEGGYMPEYGRSTGGILDVVTQSGSNEFHGSAFFYITPGVLEGPRTAVKRDGQSITTKNELASLRDFGATIGGPIMKDKLWFFLGFDASFSNFKINRQLNHLTIDPKTGEPTKDTDGAFSFDHADPIDGTQKTFTTRTRGFQYFGKLTYLINPDNNLTLSVSGTPSDSGGDGYYGGLSGTLGPYGATSEKSVVSSNDISLKYQSAFDNKNWLIDATLGWHHQRFAALPSDGSEIGSTDGLAGKAQVIYRRKSAAKDYHSLTDFENLPAGSTACTPVTVDDGMGNMKTVTPCPVSSYALGGPGFVEDQGLNRYQGRLQVTRLIQALGHHVIKAGVDVSVMAFSHVKAYTGSDLYRESVGGGRFDDFRAFGVMTAPDVGALLPKVDQKSSSTEIGGYLQDSWQIADKITLNAGLRYDAQVLFNADGEKGMALPNQISPRVGVVYDFTQQGRSKIYANFARFYESVPLDVADRSLSGEPQIASRHQTALCDPSGRDATRNHCTDDTGRFDQANALGFYSPANPNHLWTVTGGDKIPIDPDLHPQSSDEISVGGEYQIIEDATLGVRYTKRYMNYVVEDMSRDEANTYFIGNPGYGIAKDFPKARRDYDAVTFYFTKAFAHQWLAQASYTLSYLRGNWAGLFRPETGQLDPNINSDFDLRSLLPNRDGPLPGDRTHQIQIYGAKDFLLPNDMDITLGATYRTHSGEPTSFLGSHNLYGADEVFVLPRGVGDRLPWIHNIDTKLTFGMRLTKDSHLQVSMDIFNLFNFQGVTSRDETYTSDDVLPVADGTRDDIAGCVKAGAPGACNLKLANGAPFLKGDPATQTDPGKANPNFGNPTSYQTPRQFRFGAKITF